jgi:16S rRNA (cytidine1402-2'-O)-methyltransferase
MAEGKLFLIPVKLGAEASSTSIPEETKATVKHITTFFAEREKSARASLREFQLEHPQSDLEFIDIGKHGQKSGYEEHLMRCFQGEDLGLLSEAGVPAVADPGNKVVEEAHRMGIEVIPLVGPSSILMALMASGLNGQNFAFRGYVPNQKGESRSFIKKLQLAIERDDQTQILIETPYRVQKLLEELSSTLSPSLQLCLAMNIGLPSQKVIRMSVKDWKGHKLKEHKPLAVFVIGH